MVPALLIASVFHRGFGIRCLSLAGAFEHSPCLVVLFWDVVEPLDEGPSG